MRSPEPERSEWFGAEQDAKEVDPKITTFLACPS